MILRLPIDAVLSAPWYPKDRPFTEMEARLDYLLCQGKMSITDAAVRWGWSEEMVQVILHQIKKESLRPRASLYEKEEDATQMTGDVVRLFNQIFECKIGVTAKRIRQVKAILKEGNRADDPITLRQFRAVFEFKKKEWTGTDQEKYLQFETLCSDKFIGYLDAARTAYRKKMAAPKQEEGIILSGSIVKNGRAQIQ